MQQPPPDAELVRRSIAGSAAAFQDLAGRYYRPVAGFLLRRVGRPDVVEDLVQDTFLEAFRALREGRGPDTFSSWLFGIAANLAGKWLRRKKPMLFDPGEAPDAPAVASELTAHEELEEQQKRLAALDAGLAGLPPETRKLLEMKHQRGLTIEQMAAELGRPTGTIKSLLSRTYQTLRDRLRPAGEDRL